MVESGETRGDRARRVGTAWTWARRLLAERGVDDGTSDASVLLGLAVDRGSSVVWVEPERWLTRGQWVRYQDLVAQRAQGRPTAYLTGEKEFWSLMFRVDTRVLIPRPESEHLVELVLEECNRPDAHIVDMGTGSGCIGLSLCHALGESRVTGVDISAGALCVARENACRLGLARRFCCVRGRGLDALANGGVDVVVSNPPYVAQEDLVALPREVRDHEPRVALACAEGGLAVTWDVIAGAERVLSESGLLVLEVDPRRAGAVEARLHQSGWMSVGVRRDLSGRPRVVHARRGGPA
ncbi:MAG: peptide chain release factor N(5)-glutamine methyltransferase [Acidobacteriota bacterium]